MFSLCQECTLCLTDVKCFSYMYCSRWLELCLYYFSEKIHNVIYNIHPLFLDIFSIFGQDGTQFSLNNLERNKMWFWTWLWNITSNRKKSKIFIHKVKSLCIWFLMNFKWLHTLINTIFIVLIWNNEVTVSYKSVCIHHCDSLRS